MRKSTFVLLLLATVCVSCFHGASVRDIGDAGKLDDVVGGIAQHFNKQDDVTKNAVETLARLKKEKEQAILKTMDKMETINAAQKEKEDKLAQKLKTVRTEAEGKTHAILDKTHAENYKAGMQVFNKIAPKNKLLRMNSLSPNQKFGPKLEHDLMLAASKLDAKDLELVRLAKIKAARALEKAKQAGHAKDIDEAKFAKLTEVASTELARNPSNKSRVWTVLKWICGITVATLIFAGFYGMTD